MSRRKIVERTAASLRALSRLCVTMDAVVAEAHVAHVTCPAGLLTKAVLRQRYEQLYAEFSTVCAARDVLQSICGASPWLLRERKASKLKAKDVLVPGPSVTPASWAAVRAFVDRSHLDLTVLDPAPEPKTTCDTCCRCTPDNSCCRCGAPDDQEAAAETLLFDAPNHTVVALTLMAHLTRRDPGAHTVPRIRLADGTLMSVQASRNHYCTPRTDTGPWDEVEVGFPTRAIPALMPFAENPDDPTRTVYSYVPVPLLAEIIAAAGGFTKEG